MIFIWFQQPIKAQQFPEPCHWLEESVGNVLIKARAVCTPQLSLSPRPAAGAVLSLVMQLNCALASSRCRCPLTAVCSKQDQQGGLGRPGRVEAPLLLAGLSAVCTRTRCQARAETGGHRENVDHLLVLHRILSFCKNRRIERFPVSPRSLLLPTHLAEMLVTNDNRWMS